MKPSAASPRDASAGPKTRKRMGCAASTGPLYRDEHDFATTAAYYDSDGAISTTPAVLVAALAALAYA